MYEGAESQSGVANLAVTAGGLMVVKFRGLVVEDGLQGIKRQILCGLGGKMPRAVVADYSEAVIAMTHKQLLEMMAGDSPENLAHLPATIVAPAEAFDQLQAAAVTSAMRRGVWRSVYLNHQQAQQAALRMLALQGQQGMPRQ